MPIAKANMISHAMHSCKRPLTQNVHCKYNDFTNLAVANGPNSLLWVVLDDGSLKQCMIDWASLWELPSRTVVLWVMSMALPGGRTHLPWCRSCWWIRTQTWRWTTSQCRSPTECTSTLTLATSQLAKIRGILRSEIRVHVMSSAWTICWGLPWWRSPPLQAPPPLSPDQPAF